MHAGDTTEQEPGAAVGGLQTGCTGLNRHPARHLGHGGQEGQAAVFVGHGFVRDTGGAALHQVTRLVGIRSQVQVGEEDVVGAHLGTLDGLWFLHLDDELCLIPHVVRRSRNGRSGRFVVLVGGHDPVTGRRFDDNRMTASGQFPHAGGRQSNPALRVLDLLGRPDDHRRPPQCGHSRADFRETF